MRESEILKIQATIDKEAHARNGRSGSTVKQRERGSAGEKQIYV